MALKNKNKSGLMIMILVILGGCVLGEEDEFFCDKNTTLTINEGDKLCANATVTRYNPPHSTGDSEELIEIGIGWSVGNVNLSIYAQKDSIINGSVFTHETGANVWFPEINQSFSTKVTISKMDRTNKTISGSFEYHGEGAHNYQAYDYRIKGSFKDVIYSYE